MKASYWLYALVLLAVASSLPSCIKVLQDLSDDKQITAFTLELPNGTPIDSPQVSVNIGSDSIYIALDSGISVDGLIPIITTTGAVLAPASGTPQDFKNPITYKVTARDGTIQSYVVVVTQ